ncbi:GIY-YIG nuclease family protein [Echinicola vietnamensis]|uniref:Putative endonuclease containing a URI domain n=1 Tax=Echinicola vietnamensis (strain DSM 17526 / LMG 23754 / KMM 6221) TaxID=926556 RepID=L0FUU9_ECHVK|nr:GIY-YIG nuclease family protein [Echinicola vietnamensis]AGA76812.1 putative endonuclease containing a URI domain [Echinicola vietnamensis DSM 17526]AGA76813.1 putative endonuclease containing a URI domain [Echinicola vietnamensis DSM 17526]
MVYYFYILYSRELDKYYIGHTSCRLEERLRRHNTNHKGFTGRVNDWLVHYCETNQSKTEAVERELQVKSWKSRTKLVQLIERTG